VWSVFVLCVCSMFAVYVCFVCGCLVSVYMCVWCVCVCVCVSDFVLCLCVWCVCGVCVVCVFGVCVVCGVCVRILCVVCGATAGSIFCCTPLPCCLPFLLPGHIAIFLEFPFYGTFWYSILADGYFCFT